MVWQPYYRGDGVSRGVRLPAPPPWRTFPPRALGGAVFQPPPGLIEAVNAAIHLRRPLLLTGAPGSGKSSLIDSIAAELGLGTPLRWHITSRSELPEALYRYDVLSRVHAQQLGGVISSDISQFLQLGPLGTALVPSSTPRALLIDEFDKSDFDLPGDLLNILEQGVFEIPELTRLAERTVFVREWGGQQQHAINRGIVECTTFPIIVITSNGERDFAAPFLRRCIRFTMPAPSFEFLARIVTAHLGQEAGATSLDVVAAFMERLEAGENLAVDQLLNAVFLLTGGSGPEGAERDQVEELLLRELSRA